MKLKKGGDEGWWVWCEWYKCTSCDKDDIAFGFNYCPSCGEKIEWEH